MVFTSTTFLYGFLPAFLLLYALTPRLARALLLAAASFVFYGWWKPQYVVLLLASSALDYVLGGRIAAARARGGSGRRWLWLSVAANLGLLGWFKYANFGAASLRALLQSLGCAGDFAWTEVVLPVGISFYTFQTMSYSIDLYRGEVEPSRSFVDFLCYVSMFPQLVAGPIVRYSVVEHELRHRRHSAAAFAAGVLFLQVGLAKKLLLADALAPLANHCFGQSEPSQLGPVLAWLGVLAYAYQIYFDFSGYSDMAIGLGLMLGFHFPINFDAPYRSASITEFWRRWHISLSTWLRDYLYVPLGGNRHGSLRTYANLLLTMLLGGLWHGAAWNFVAWGGYQGLWLVLERLAGKRPLYSALPAALRIAITFVVVLAGWVWFRARDLGHAVAYLAAMGGAGSDGSGSAGSAMSAASAANPMPETMPWLELGLAAAITWTLPTSQRLVARRHPLFVLLLQGLFVFAALHLRHTPHAPPFLYFRF
ncbi:MAG: MBOAT family protein [Planctomycetes bacterium]|nr:MBOAT family protein [Planctomycetota bacterium]